MTSPALSASALSPVISEKPAKSLPNLTLQSRLEQCGTSQRGAARKKSETLPCPRDGPELEPLDLRKRRRIINIFLRPLRTCRVLQRNGIHTGQFQASQFITMIEQEKITRELTPAVKERRMGEVGHCPSPGTSDIVLCFFMYKQKQQRIVSCQQR